MQTYFVDTNIFLRILTGDIEKQKDDCIFFLKEAQNKNLNVVTSSLVLSEIAWTLMSYYKFPRERVSLPIRSILNLDYIKIIDDYEPHIAIDFFDRFNIKFIDSFIASFPQLINKKWAIVSYDREFDWLGIKRFEPSEVITGNGQ